MIRGILRKILIGMGLSLATFAAFLAVVIVVLGSVAHSTMLAMRPKKSMPVRLIPYFSGALLAFACGGSSDPSRANGDGDGTTGGAGASGGEAPATGGEGGTGGAVGGAASGGSATGGTPSCTDDCVCPEDLGCAENAICEANATTCGCKEGQMGGDTFCHVDHAVTCPLEGLAFGYLTEPGEGPGMITDRATALERVAMIADTTKGIRTYGCQGTWEIAEVAKTAGLSVAMGAYLSANDAENALEIACIIDVCNSGNCDAAIVGNEFEFSGASIDQILDGIDDVRAEIDGAIPITTAVVLGSYQAHPELVAAVDELYVHIYASGLYPVQHATTYLHASYLKVREAAGEKPIVIADSGWPSDGTMANNAFGPVSYSETEAAAYLRDFVSWAETELRPIDSYFYFAALDEPWKAAVEGNWADHWGISTRGVLKEGIFDTLDCERNAPHWGTTRIPDESAVGDPTLTVTQIPELGTANPICGTANYVVPVETRIVVYVNTEFGWYGPKSARGEEIVLDDGTWCSTYASPGTADEDAAEIAVLLIPSTYDAPLVLGDGTLPAALTSAALADEIVSRE